MDHALKGSCALLLLAAGTASAACERAVLDLGRNDGGVAAEDGETAESGVADAGDAGDAGDMGVQPDTGGEPIVAAHWTSGDWACARVIDGRVKCWGDDAYGQHTEPAELADCSGRPCTYFPNTVDPLRGMLTASLGATHACAEITAGVRRCFGSNVFGELGLGLADPDPHMTPLPLPASAGAVTRTALGRHSTCALDAAGRVTCWGLGHAGQLGRDPARLESCPVSTAVAAELGLPGTRNLPCATTPGAVAGLGAVRTLALGAYHACAVQRDGALFCWGSNDAGQLGIGSTTLTSTSVAQRVARDRVVELALGDHHTCARLDDGSLHCWGAHDMGQLGVGTLATDRCGGTPCRPSPTPVIALADGVTAVAAGRAHTCVRTTSGAPRCFGSHGSGQLGVSEMAPDVCVGVPCARTPVPPYDLPAIATVTAGAEHTCMTTPAMNLLCFGDNQYGQAGGGHGGDRNYPAPVYGLQ